MKSLFDSGSDSNAPPVDREYERRFAAIVRHAAKSSRDELREALSLVGDRILLEGIICVPDCLSPKGCRNLATWRVKMISARLDELRAADGEAKS